MKSHDLTDLQKRVLEILAEISPPWTLTGGGALVGFHLHHRETRDLDLFWHRQDDLATVRDACMRRLTSSRLEVTSIQTAPTFTRWLVRGEGETVVVDLVAEPVAPIEPPGIQVLGEASIQVDTPREILVNKLCTLLSRAEIRDLVDVKALLSRGEDLDWALRKAPSKDGGFSAITLAWVLRGLPLERLAEREETTEQEVEELRSFLDSFVDRLLRKTRPD